MINEEALNEINERFYRERQEIAKQFEQCGYNVFHQPTDTNYLRFNADLLQELEYAKINDRLSKLEHQVRVLEGGTNNG